MATPGPPSRRPAAGTAAVLTALVLVGMAGASRARGAQDGPAAGGAFGFRIGEERRYALGPPEVVGAGEFETWTLALVAVEGKASTLRATFAYGHEFARRGRGNEVATYRGAARVTVNGHGFPLQVEYEPAVRNGRTSGNGRDRITWEAGGYRVESDGDGGSFRVRPPSWSQLGSEVPTGLLPGPAENPALLTLATWRFQAEGLREMEFLAVVPSTVRSPAARRLRLRPPRRPTRSWGAPTPGSRRTDPFRRARLEFREVSRVELGGRTVQAIRLQSSVTDGDVWIAADGALLRIDRLVDLRQGHIRLLRPFEY